MTQPPIDDATLAAFIDNTQTPAERERLAAILSRDPEQYRAFMEAAAIVAELQAADEGTASAPEVTSVSVTPLRPRRRWLTMGVPVLLAAGLAVVVLQRPGSSAGPAPLFAAVQDAALVAPGAGGDAVTRALGSGWDTPAWGTVRGGDGSATLNAGVRARLGVRAVELEVAGAAGDTAGAQRAAESVAALIGAAPGAAPLVSQLRAAPIADREQRARRHAMLRSLSGDTASFDAGAWTEAARLAILASRPALVRHDGALGMALPGVIGALSASVDAGAWANALGVLRGLADSGAPVDAATLRQRVDSVLGSLPAEEPSAAR